MFTVSRARPRWILIAGVVAGLLLGSVPAALADPPWLAPFDLAAPSVAGTSGAPAVAVAPDGSAVIAFLQPDGAINRVVAASRAPGGSFGPAVPISDDTVSATSPKAGIDPQGNATIAWTTATAVVQAAYRPAGRSWGPVESLGAADDGNPPALAVGANGGAAVGWAADVPSATQTAQVAVRTPGASTFAAPLSASSATMPYPNASWGVFTPGLAMDASGGVIAIWTRQVTNSWSETPYVVESAIKPAGSASFGAATNRSAYVAEDAYIDPTVVVTPSGQATAIWRWYDGASTHLDYASRAPGLDFGASGTLTNPAPAVGVTAVNVAANDRGDVAVAWSQAGSVYASVRPNGGSFARSEAIAGPPALSTTASIAISHSGETVVAWTTSSVGDYSVFSARRRPFGTFGDITQVVHGQQATPTTSYNDPAVALDDQGNGFLAVRRDVTGPHAYTTVGIGYDAVAPVVSGLSVPSTAIVGRSVSLRASASDRMSASTISWDFGDGSAVPTGGSVTHVFRKRGVFTVKVAATDSVGNRAESTRLVQVRPVPRVAATSSLKTTKARAGRTRILSLRVTHLLRGDTVSLVCMTKAHACTKATKRVVKTAGSSVSLTKYVKNLTLKPKARLVVRISRPGTASRTIAYTTRAGKAPTRKVT
jgi:PKD domain-containing protein